MSVLQYLLKYTIAVLVGVKQRLINAPKFSVLFPGNANAFVQIRLLNVRVEIKAIIGMKHLVRVFVCQPNNGQIVVLLDTRLIQALKHVHVSPFQRLLHRF